MPGALGPRFALEAGFLILLAVVLGFADLSAPLIILIMALAWVLVSLIEYFAWRQGPRFPTRYATAGGAPVLEEDFVAEPVRTPDPVPSPAPPAVPVAEEQTIVERPPAREPEPEPAEAEPAEPTFAGPPLRSLRLEPLAPRPRKRFGLFGPRTRGESTREEER